jgi:hypothetical protein
MPPFYKHGLFLGHLRKQWAEEGFLIRFFGSGARLLLEEMEQRFGRWQSILSQYGATNADSQ